MNDGAQGPDVAGMRAPALDELLRGAPGEGADLGHRRVMAFQQLAQAHICQLDAAVGSNEDVGGLQVQVGNADAVQVDQGDADLLQGLLAPA